MSDITARKHKGNPQSEAANLRIAGRKLPLRLKIYDRMREMGQYTAEQIVFEMSWKLQSVSARMSELKADGWIEATGRVVNGYAEFRAVTKSENPQGDMFE